MTSPEEIKADDSLENKVALEDDTYTGKKYGNQYKIEVKCIYNKLIWWNQPFLFVFRTLTKEQLPEPEKERFEDLGKSNKIALK